MRDACAHDLRYVLYTKATARHMVPALVNLVIAETRDKKDTVGKEVFGALEHSLLALTGRRS